MSNNGKIAFGKHFALKSKIGADGSLCVACKVGLNVAHQCFGAVIDCEHAACAVSVGARNVVYGANKVVGRKRGVALKTRTGNGRKVVGFKTQQNVQTVGVARL